jgi:hypothetical protein
MAAMTSWVSPALPVGPQGGGRDVKNLSAYEDLYIHECKYIDACIHKHI